MQELAATDADDWTVDGCEGEGFPNPAVERFPIVIKPQSLLRCLSDIPLQLRGRQQIVAARLRYWLRPRISVIHTLGCQMDPRWPSWRPIRRQETISGLFRFVEIGGRFRSSVHGLMSPNLNSLLTAAGSPTRQPNLAVREMYVRPYPGPGVSEPISTEGGNTPAWSRDGRELFYTTLPSPDLRIRMMAVPVTAGATFRAGPPGMLFEGRYFSTVMVRSDDVAPDSSRFLMVRDVEAAVPQAYQHHLGTELVRGVEAPRADEVTPRYHIAVRAVPQHNSRS